MFADRRSAEYEEGVERFLQFGLKNGIQPNSMRCPCVKCGNVVNQPILEIRNHLYFNGIDRSYQTWIWHGEECSSKASTGEGPNTEEIYLDNDNDFIGEATDMVHAAYENFDDDPEEFMKLLEDSEKRLYRGCRKFTKLSALVKLYNLKAKHSWSDKGFSELLGLLVDMLPEDNVLPSSMHEAKKTLSALGLEYEKIHACPNDCILYWKEYKDAIVCPNCGLSRWKLAKNSKEQRKGVPAKVLWYFPPIPRFQRMYKSSETANNLVWHAKERVRDDKLRHPADSPSWKLVDNMWPDFGAEHRNLRLALSADGINPHSSLSSRYSCWPIIMICYNLPPWLCMKRKFMMLTLLLSSPRQPGNDIDLYLAPLVDDLKRLWDVGIDTFDARCQEMFKLKAVLLWTINDFPAYGNLSGCIVKGYYACPICGKETHACRLKHGKKMSYIGHRRFLPHYHPYRKQKKAFNGKQEWRSAPKPLTGDEVLKRVEKISFSIGKNKVKSKTVDKDEKSCWKKKSIFFDLHYWKYLYVRHNLDVMHIEKNICESLIGTLLDIPGKTKDGVASRLDLIEMGIRNELAPRVEGKRTYLPPACYTLTKEEKRSFCETILKLKVPNGYCSNFANIVSMQDLRLLGMKSHDCHVLMQQILPVAIRNLMPKHVRYAITRLCFFFKALCSKVVDVPSLDHIQHNVVTTLCLLEKFFPPSFFDIMVHLTVHLVREVRLCGPVYLRWMYPFERFMKILKGYVRNRNRPEGCIAESYIAEEGVEFCSEYLNGADAIGIPTPHDCSSGTTKPLSRGCVSTISRDEWEQAHLYILENTIEVVPYVE